MPAKKKKLTLEEALARLEDITNIIESLETPLEKSLELYREGMELSVFCAETLEGAKQEIMVLQKSAEGLFERPFVQE
ncbi:MAG: exodeoxyribonuclease VII small subunit [Defluviitaleaceae bacterium]|nr:exodeoxyribonuclease VII small subunit [Defluviitaleaceae bacterium]MCL2836757.1 exodeoxyribonuclease VII small subunit [Defluviitaleaceae bacterium]